MAVLVVKFLREGYKMCGQKSAYHRTQKKLLYFLNKHTVPSCQKLTVFSENKVLEKMKLSKTQ